MRTLAVGLAILAIVFALYALSMTGMGPMAAVVSQAFIPGAAHLSAVLPDKPNIVFARPPRRIRRMPEARTGVDHRGRWEGAPADVA